MANDKHTARIRILFGVFFAVALLVAGKLYLVQIVHGQDFAARADRQYALPRTALFDRGSIYFEDKDGGRISAATVEAGFVIAINPAALTDAQAVYEKLSSVAEIDRAEFLKRASKTDDPYEEIAHRVPKQTADAVKEMKLPGVSVYKEQWRMYPGGPAAGQTLGFVGFEGDTLAGRYGLERQYDAVLSRQSDNLYVNFFADVFGSVRDVVEAETTGEGEGDIVTTIEPTVQAFLEDTIATVREEWGSRQVGGIIMDPMTGEVRALAAVPAFDPNSFNEVENPSVFANPLVENVFEMGSSVKPLTVAAGLDAGVITPNTTYNDTGSVSSDGYTVYNYDKRGRGVVDMHHVLGESLNTGVAYIVSRLGNRRFGDYFRKFGLDTKTGIDLPNETRGLADNLKSPRNIEYMTASFGQGVAATPIAMARALATLGNGGLLVTPHVVKEIKYDLGNSKVLEYPSGERVISATTSEVITKILVRVVDEFLVGGTVKLDRYSIAAKTGTAQIADKHGGGYYDDRFLHSFFGYFPAYKPRFLIFLYSLEPKNARFASETLTQPFMDITKFLINYYEIPPDR